MLGGSKSVFSLSAAFLNNCQKIFILVRKH